MKTAAKRTDGDPGWIEKRAKTPIGSMKIRQLDAVDRSLSCNGFQSRLSTLAPGSCIRNAGVAGSSPASGTSIFNNIASSAYSALGVRCTEAADEPCQHIGETDE